MLAFLEHRDQWDRLREHPELFDLAAEEIVRWASPVIYFRRSVTHDIELRGQQLKAGDKITVWYPSANRDEDVFERPFEFDVGRDPNPHIGFGGRGPHFCLGSNLARLEIKALFEELTRRIPDIEAVGSAGPAAVELHQRDQAPPGAVVDRGELTAIAPIAPFLGCSGGVPIGSPQPTTAFREPSHDTEVSV